MAKLVLFVWIMVLLCNLFYHLLLMLFFSLLDNITEKICFSPLIFRYFTFNKHILIAVLPIFTNNIIKNKNEILVERHFVDNYPQKRSLIFWQLY